VRHDEWLLSVVLSQRVGVYLLTLPALTLDLWTAMKHCDRIYRRARDSHSLCGEQ
jgi:hypothetical protein